VVKPADPILGAALAEHLINNRDARGDKPTADHTLLRGSDAYRCARQIAFGALKIPRAVPYTPDALMAFDAGEHHHTRLQGILASKFGAELEVPISYKDIGIDISGHADAVYDDMDLEHTKVTVELKSMKAYPFVRAAGGVDKYGHHVDPEGPKPEHVIQAGIYADAPQIKAGRLHMVYINKEDGRVAEWLLDIGEQYGANGETVLELVHQELDRLTAIGKDIRAGLLPWRTVPGHGVVKDPDAAKGADGYFWGCSYCSWQPLCARLPVSKVAAAQISQPAVSVAQNGTQPPDQWDTF
jgi:hypothetical protein